MNEILKIWRILSWLLLLSTSVIAATPSEDLRFYKKAEYSAGNYPFKLIEGNFNEDQTLDLAVAGPNQTNLFVLMGNGDGTFSQRYARSVPASHHLFRWSNATSAPDQLLCGIPLAYQMFRFAKDGQLHETRKLSDFWIASPIERASPWTTSAPIIGVDTNWNLHVRDLLSDTKSFLVSTTTTFHQPGYVWGGDLNEDQMIDWVVVPSSGHITVGLSQVTNYLEQTITNIASVSWIHPADLNQDGQKELIVCGRHGSIVLLKQNRNRFIQNEVLKGTIEPLRAQSADLDRDGHLDLIVSDRNDSGLKVYRGQGDLKFHPPLAVHTGGLPGEFVVADFNQDKRLDLAVTSSLYSKVMVFLQDPGSRHNSNHLSAELFPASSDVSISPVTNSLPAEQPETTIHPLPRGVQLPQNRVLSILQTSDGFIWFGTLDGLARYDGHELISYTRSSFEALNNGACLELAEGEPGELWIGTNAGLLHFRNNQFTKYLNEHPPLTNGLRHWNIGALLFDKKTRKLWIGTDNGLQFLTNGIFHKVGKSLGITALHQSGDMLFVGTSTGLYRLDHSSSNLIPLSTWDAPSEISDMVSDEQGRTWAARLDGTVILCEKDQVTLSNGRNLPEQELRLLNLRQANFMITRANLFSWDPERGVLQRFKNNEWGEIFCKYQDPEGTLWIGTSSGVYRLQLQPFHTIDTRNGLSHDDVFSITETKDGTLWVGTRSGLNSFRNGQWKHFFQQDGLNSDFIYALYSDQANRLWVGNNKAANIGPAGVNCIIPGDVIYGNGIGFTWTSDRTRSIFQDSKKRMWVASEEGLWLWQGSSVVNLTTKGDFPSKTPLGTLEDTQGSLWFGSTGQGVFRYDGTSFQHFDTDDGLSSNYAAPVFEDEHGAIWFGSANGLTRYKNGAFAQITTLEGLFDAGVFCLLEDTQGYYWMSSNRGIYKAHKNDLNYVADKLQGTVRCIAYNYRDGLLSSEANGGTIPAACKTRDGRLWFATIKGIAVVDPSRLSERKLFFPPKLEQISVNGAPLSSLGNPMGSESVIALGSGSIPLLQFSYTSPAFDSVDLVEFQYYLEGQDPNWRAPVKERLASYTNLKPGLYRFHLRARKGQSDWVQNASIFAFRITPYFHQRTSIRVAASLAFLSALFGIHSWRMKKLKRLREMQHSVEVEKERSRIAQDLHDQLGSAVSEVTLLAELAAREKSIETKNRRLTSIKDSLSEISDSLSEVVWALNKRNDTLQSLLHYLETYSSKVLSLQGIQLRFDKPDKELDYPMDTLARHAIVLIVKEAIHNVLKHSKATAVQLQFSHKTGLEITLQDNGQGFDRSIARDGNGLYNMEQRALSINAQLSIQSAPGSGTLIRLVVPPITE